METRVGIIRCPDYQRDNLKRKIALLLDELALQVRPGVRVLLKPNLITATRKDGLACTHPEVVAATAEWFLDHGAEVMVGDSPAFGTMGGVMRACGMSQALKKLPVRPVPFTRVRKKTLASGLSVGVAAAALECDLLVNLPKLKTHGQLFMTLAIKNYFGTVVGLRKPWHHLCHGHSVKDFAGLLVDLLGVLPPGPTLIDGVVAMQGNGPVHGDPSPLNLLAAAMSPVALETALLAVLDLDQALSPVSLECQRRNLPGAREGDLVFPFLAPGDIQVDHFVVPDRLQPISFAPSRILVGSLKRLLTALWPHAK